MRMAKRNYTRRSDQERIEELQSKITRIQTRIETRKLRESPINREAAKVQRMLRRFAQVAIDHGREDLANSTQAFAAGLERSVTAATDTPNNRRNRSGEGA